MADTINNKGTEVNQNDEVIKKHFFENKKKLIGVSLASCLLLILAIYVGGVFSYKDKFLNNTSINGIDVSKLTVEKATAKIKEKITQNINLDLVFSDGSNQVIDGLNSSIKLNSNVNLDKLVKNQNRFLWFMSYFDNNKLNVNNLINIDEKLIESKINNLPQMNVSNQIKSKDAYVSYENGDFSIVSDVIGTEVDKPKLLTIVKDALLSDVKKIDLKKSDLYKKAEITKDNPALVSKVAAAKKYASAKITYETPKGKVFVLDGKTLVNWLTKDEKGNWVRNDKVWAQKALSYVKNLALSYNVIGETRQFKTHKGNIITVSGGSYGLRIKPQTETNELLKDLYANKVVKRTPVTTGALASGENGGIGSTYAEVDVSEQKMYYFRNGQLLLNSPVMTGTLNDPTRRTRPGAYFIYMKQAGRTLRGLQQADGTYPYSVPVKYWMPFNGGVGFHDASWLTTFGTNRYLTNGSHGCVDMPPENAGKLFSLISENTPVIVY